MRGRLIVLEGTDGSGKATQAKLLLQSLEARGVPCREIDFPRYGNPFAEPVARYLRGALGSSPGDVNAYAASTMFAVDRYASYKEDWGGFYESGGVVVANRYTTSNAVHQASKLPEEERRAYLDWLFDLAAALLMRRRERETHTQADIHERDGEYLRRCRESAGEIARGLGWTVVDCAVNGVPRTPEDIHAQVADLAGACLSH